MLYDGLNVAYAACCWFSADIRRLGKQGHHHDGDQAARRPDMMCSISGRPFTTPLFGVRGDWDQLIR